MDNLNEFLNSKSCLNTRNENVNGYQVDARYERDSMTSAQIRNLTADKIIAGTISVAIGLGTSNIILDGANTRIVINDGTVDRIIIGKL